MSRLRFLRLLLAAPVLACLMAATPWTPATPGAPTPEVWFDGADSATLTVDPGNPGRFIGWQDKSGNGRHATTDPAFAPSASSLNGKGTVDFGPLLYGSTASPHFVLPEAQVQTVFIVWGSQNDGGFLLTHTGIYPWHRGTDSSNGSPALFDVANGWSDPSLRSGNADSRLDGAVIDPTATGLSGGWDVVSVRTSGSTRLPFNSLALDRTYRSGGQNIAELIAFSGRLSDVAVQRYEGYLAWKWGLQSKLPVGHPYKYIAPQILIANGSFELGARPSTANGGNDGYRYLPVDQGPWAFDASGVTAGGTAFTSSNTPPTDGALAAFVQYAGSLTQEFYVDTGASYAVTLRAVQRANHGDPQALQVEIDGQRLSAFPLPVFPISSTWLYAATPSLPLAPGSHTLKIFGLWNQSDRTAFIDEVSIAPVAVATPTQIAGSFEEWQIGAQNYHYEAGGQPWTFPGNAGLVANGSGLGNPNAPQGQQAAFVKAGGLMQQSWTDAGGSYALRLKTAAMGGTAPTLVARIDGVAVGSWTVPAGYADRQAVVSLAAGMHTLSLTTSGGDAFVDDVRLTSYVDPGPPGAFNAFESSTALGAVSGAIHTKVAGASFPIDVVALDASRTAVMSDFTGTVRIEILDGTDNAAPADSGGCRAGWVPVATSAPVDVVFAFEDAGRKTVTLADAEAWRNLRLRFTSPATGAPDTVACSGDAFANRPLAFTSFAASDASAATAGTARGLANVSASGGVVHKAGRPFTVRASVVNAGGGATVGYSGTPTPVVSACTGSACENFWSKVADEGGSFAVTGAQTVRYGKNATWTTMSITGFSPCSNGVFGDPLVGTVKECQVATLGALTLTPTASAGAIQRNGTYSEAGSFALQLVDTDFASVDDGDGSSAAERTIASSPINVGRFVPDHFDVAPLVAPVLKTFDSSSCAARSFTYVGQPFGYTNAPQARVLARNAAGATTALYRAALWKLVPASVGQAFTPLPAAPALDVSAATPPALTSNDDGTGLVVGTATDKLRFERPAAAPVAPFAASIALRWAAQDTADAGVAGNGIVDTPTPLVFSNIAFDAGNQFRFGALRLMPAYGSELVDLPVLMEAQYWDGQRMATNDADQCTAVPASALAMGNYQRSLAACKTAVAAVPATLASGRAYARLAKPGPGNSGSVDVSLQLGGSASGQTCQSVGAAAAGTAAANLPWLQGRWNGASAFDQNPATRASFGQYRSPIIYRREIF